MTDQPKITPINLDRTFTAEEVSQMADAYEAAAFGILKNMSFASGFAFAAGVFLGKFFL